jgi:hypothetical protein
VGVALSSERRAIDNSALKIFAAGAAEDAAFVMRMAADGGQLHLSGLAAPLALAPTWGSVYSNGLSEFIFGHQVSSWFLLLPEVIQEQTLGETRILWSTTRGSPR